VAALNEGQSSRTQELHRETEYFGNNLALHGTRAVVTSWLFPILSAMIDHNRHLDGFQNFTRGYIRSLSKHKRPRSIEVGNRFSIEQARSEMQRMHGLC
jgi:hypothetical protein